MVNQVSTWYLPISSGSLSKPERKDSKNMAFRTLYTYKDANHKTRTLDATKWEIRVRNAIAQERGIKWIVEEIFKKKYEG
ncbi:MAG: hypothetical protein HC908_01630 [Calothrix sp. SM1_7_51]|nr:hypothetical protein [Calothrix sp. SM1_7_51]